MHDDRPPSSDTFARTDPYERADWKAAREQVDANVVGPYRLIRKLGEGGMGTVWEAHHGMLDRTVALKMIRAELGIDRETLERFELEARSMARIRHPHVLRIHEVAVGSDHVYMAMDLVAGGSLKDRIVRDGPLPVRDAIALTAKLADALHHAHRLGIIHRDLKPANILLTLDGEPLLTDFGLAKDLTADWLELTQSGVVLGTPDYMSPEHLSGKHGPLDGRADVYGLGATLYEMLIGRPPFKGQGAIEIAHQILTKDAPSPSAERAEVDRAVDTIVARCLAKEPEHRFEGARALAADCRRWLANEPIEARPVSLRERLALLARRRGRTIAIAGASILVALVAALAILARDASRAREIAAEARRAEAAARDAKAARAETRATTERFEHLADAVQVQALVYAFEALPPDRPDLADDQRTWLARAEPLLARAKLRGDELREIGKERRPDEPTRFRIATLRKLVDALAELARLENVMRARLEESVSLLERTVDGPAAPAWSAAIASMGIDGSPYLDPIEPQLGLVPLGPDPQSSLLEFAHALSGEVPVREPDGRLNLDAGSAIILVLIPGGTFAMGAPERPDDDARSEIRLGPSSMEEPVHEVTLPPYLIGKHEVTQAQWRRMAFLAGLPEDAQAPSHYHVGYKPKNHVIGPTHPVEQVSWLSARRVLDAVGLDVPTEAQWERAATGGAATRFATGDGPESLRHAENLRDGSYAAWAAEAGATRYRRDVPWEDGYPVHAPVGTFRPNGWGLHDFGGNVREWCRDFLGLYREATDPITGEREGESVYRVLRGGSWLYLEREARPAYRSNASATAIGTDLGVRAGRDLDR